MYPLKLSVLLLISLSCHLCSAVKLKFKGFDGTDLLFLGDSELASGSLSLTRDAPFSHGRGLYSNKIPAKFPNSSAPLPFKTSFTFSITPLKTNPIPGHGLAFVIVPFDNDDAAGPAGFLGFLNRTNNGNPKNHAFAIEFDVVQNKQLRDINGNHVGVDVNSLASLASYRAGYWVKTKSVKKTEWSFQELKLSSGDKYRVWVEYENTKLTVTMAPEKVKKPKRPLIETSVDLSKVFLDEMYVGFCGAMGRDIQRHQIWNWTFNNDAKKLA